MLVRRGTIKRFGGSWGSGLGFLEIEDSEGAGVEQVPCENAATVRALEGAFGDVIAEGHCVNPEGGHVGQEIYWSYDETGLVLASFTPVDEASEELLDVFENERAEA